MYVEQWMRSAAGERRLREFDRRVRRAERDDGLEFGMSSLLMEGSFTRPFVTQPSYSVEGMSTKCCILMVRLGWMGGWGG